MVSATETLNMSTAMMTLFHTVASVTWGSANAETKSQRDKTPLTQRNWGTSIENAAITVATTPSIHALVNCASECVQRKDETISQRDKTRLMERMTLNMSSSAGPHFKQVSGRRPEGEALQHLTSSTRVAAHRFARFHG